MHDLDWQDLRYFAVFARKRSLPAAAKLMDADLESQIAAARAGVGIAALPSFLAARHPELVRIAARGRPVAREVWLVVHEDLRGAPSIRAVMDFLVAATTELR